MFDIGVFPPIFFTLSEIGLHYVRSQGFHKETREDAQRHKYPIK